MDRLTVDETGEFGLLKWFELNSFHRNIEIFALTVVV